MTTKFFIEDVPSRKEKKTLLDAIQKFGTNLSLSGNTLNATGGGRTPGVSRCVVFRLDN